MCVCCVCVLWVCVLVCVCVRVCACGYQSPCAAIVGVSRMEAVPPRRRACTRPVELQRGGVAAWRRPTLLVLARTHSHVTTWQARSPHAQRWPQAPRCAHARKARCGSGGWVATPAPPVAAVDGRCGVSARAVVRRRGAPIRHARLGSCTNTALGAATALSAAATSRA